jgi:hypothetical protein
MWQTRILVNDGSLKILPEGGSAMAVAHGLSQHARTRCARDTIASVLHQSLTVPLVASYSVLSPSVAACYASSWTR